MAGASGKFYKVHKEIYSLSENRRNRKVSKPLKTDIFKMKIIAVVS